MSQDRDACEAPNGEFLAFSKGFSCFFALNPRPLSANLRALLLCESFSSCVGISGEGSDSRSLYPCNPLSSAHPELAWSYVELTGHASSNQYSAAN